MHPVPIFIDGVPLQGQVLEGSALRLLDDSGIGHCAKIVIEMTQKDWNR